jgi:hypothetical protein
MVRGVDGLEPQAGLKPPPLVGPPSDDREAAGRTELGAKRLSPPVNSAR